MRTFAIVAILLICTPAAATSISVDKLFRDPEYVQFSLSPKGDYLGIRREYNDVESVIITEPEKEKLYVVFKVDETEKAGIRSIVWIDSDSLMVRWSDVHGLPHYLIVDCSKKQDGTLDLKTHDTVLLADIIDPLPSEPDTVMLSVHIPGRGRVMDVFKVDLREVDRNYKFRHMDRLNSRISNGIQYGTDAEHRLRYAVEFEDGGRNYLYLDVEDDTWKTFLTLKEEKKKKGEESDDSEEISTVIFIGFIDNDTMAVATNVDRDKYAIMEFDLAKKEFGEVLFESPSYDVEYAELDPKTGKLRMVAISESGRTNFKYFSPTDKELSDKLKQAYPGKQALLYDATDDGNKILVSVFSETSPGTYYFVDVNSLAARPLADENPELMGAKFCGSDTITVTSKDGLEIEGFITMPATPKAGVPLIVMPHGGPIAIKDYDLFNPEVQFFADRGFAVLRVNYRGSFGRGKKFMTKGVGQWGKGIEDDIEMSLDHVLANYPVDPEKVCIVGASYGGYSALMSSIRSPEKYKCAVSRLGLSDLNLLFNQTNTMKVESVQKSVSSVVGDPEDPDFDPVAVSPFYLAKKLEVPVMLTAGWKDPIADAEQTNRMRVALDLLEKPYEYILYKEAGHGHRYWSDEHHELLMIERFIRKSLALPTVAADGEEEIRDVENKIVAGVANSKRILHISSYPESAVPAKKASPAPEPSPAPEGEDAGAEDEEAEAESKAN